MPLDTQVLGSKPCFLLKGHSDVKEKWLGKHSNNGYGKARALPISPQRSLPVPHADLAAPGSTGKPVFLIRPN